MTRDHGLDRLKAAAISCVVLIHSLGPRTNPAGTYQSQLLPLLLEWAVPSFFFAAGYLRARTSPYPAHETFRWVQRLVPTYLIASVCALLFRWVVQGDPVVPVQILVDLAVGSAFGIFYFVPLLLGALLFSILLARFPRSVPWWTAILVGALVLTRVHVGYDPLGRAYGFAGILRSPLFWWGYFASGWFVKRYISGRVDPRHLLLVGVALGITAFVAPLTAQVSVARASCRVAAALGITLSLLFLSKRPVGRLGAVLSDYSYEIYLFHFFAIALARTCGYAASGIVVISGVWLVALSSSLVAGSAVRAMLRPLGLSESRSPRAG